MFNEILCIGNSYRIKYYMCFGCIFKKYFNIISSVRIFFVSMRSFEINKSKSQDIETARTAAVANKENFPVSIIFLSQKRTSRGMFRRKKRRFRDVRVRPATRTTPMKLALFCFENFPTACEISLYS